ncbi:MAG: radical SAM protein [Thermoplasmata archaeon]
MNKLPHKLPGPWRITFDTNPHLCNLHCIMCDTHSIYNPEKVKNDHIMQFWIIEKVVKSALPYLKEIIPSTMGEPLLYRDFSKIIELAMRYNIKINLTTNGTFPIYGVEKWGKAVLPVASDVKISMNGINRETGESIMVGINHKKQIDNIIKFVNIRDEVRHTGTNWPTVTLQVTFMERNLKELPDILRFAIDKGIDRLKGHHLWITWPQIKGESLKKNTETISKWNDMVDTLYDIVKSTGSKLKLANIHKLPIENNENVPEEFICPFLGKEAWIAWDGTFNVCCAPDVMRRTFGYFGNVKDKDLIELWNSDAYNNLIDNWGTNYVCRICNMRRPKDEVYDGHE